MQESNNEFLINKSLGFLEGGGEMGALVRSYDWANHPLGLPEFWPESLKLNIRLILNSGFPMFIWWSKDLYMFHNDAYLPALGNKHPKALGASARVMWAEIWDDIGQVVENILQGGNPFYAESLLLLLERKGFSEETYWTLSYSPVFGDNGKINGIFCSCYEVTSTILNERRLKCLKNVSDKMSEIQALEQACQLTCDILLENKEDLPFSMIYLLNDTSTAARLVGKSENIPAAVSPLQIDLLESEQPWNLARTLATKNSTLSDYSDLFSEEEAHTGWSHQVKQVVVIPVMRPGQHHVIGFFIAGISPKLEYNEDYKGFHTLLASQIATSITSVQARQELARQQEYLQNIFQQAPVGIAIVRGPQYIIDLANPGVCEIWGRKPEDVLGKPVGEALAEVVDQGILELLDSVVSSGKPFISNEFPLDFERNGKLETVYLNFIYHPMRDEQGIVNGVIAVAVDVSEQVTYRKSVEALNVELLSTNADLDNFVYSASHDLKAPILNIEGLMQALVEYLSDESLQNETVSSIIKLIHSSIDRFKRTVLDLTEVAKIQRQADDDVSRNRLIDVIKEVQLDFELTVAESGAQIVTDIDPDAVIQFSSKNLRSIIYNLLSNALKYKSDARSPVIKIVVKNEADRVLLSVQDNGLGIEEEDKAKIFSMFKRMHDHVEGSGIGLYIVKRVVENAGGKIEVESEVGKGSTFNIYFKR